jgi:hypothetical protein
MRCMTDIRTGVGGVRRGDEKERRERRESLLCGELAAGSPEREGGRERNSKDRNERR